MTSKNIKTSTESTTQIQPKKPLESFWDWSKIWWPVELLFIILCVAGFTKYLYPNQNVYSFMIYLIKAIGVLMVVMYVIYTRLLSIETKKMAEASLGMYSSDKGTVRVVLFQTICDYKDVLNDVKEITKTIHITDKNLTTDEFEKYLKEGNLPAISVKLINMSARRIEATEIQFKTRHTGNDQHRRVTCNVNRNGTILPWMDKEIVLMVAPEGDVEVLVETLEYFDGDKIKQINISEKIKLNRIRKPVND